MTTDIERAAFEGWVVGRLENVSPTTFLRRPTGEYFSAFIELRWEGWQARASRPVVVTDEAIIRGQTALIEEMDAGMNNTKRAVKKILSAALNGGT